MTIKRCGVPCAYKPPGGEGAALVTARRLRGVYRPTAWRHRSSCCLPSEDGSDSSGHEGAGVRRRPPPPPRRLRGSSYSDSDSINDSVDMPVGIEALGLKSSLSLSSLPPGTPSDSPEHARLRVRNDRPYHSLTKQNRRAEQSASWRKSWGSGISSDDREFWEAFQADYDYLMAQTMVPQAAQTPVPRGTPLAPPVWSLQECLDRFAQLYSWLKRFQDSIYAKRGVGEDWTQRASEELQRHRCRLNEFNEGARELVRHCPHVEEEVAWRLRYVNDAWHGVETALNASGGADELRYLRRWLCAMETKVEPVSFHRVWTEVQLEARRREHAVVQRDIQAHSGVVTSVVRSSSGLEGAALERQYHNLLLRCFEWQCHIEALLARQTSKSPVNVSSDSDGEPVAKCPRYSQQAFASDTADDITHGEQLGDVVMERTSPVLRRRDAMGRTRTCSPARRCGIAKFPDAILGEDHVAGAGAVAAVVAGSVTTQPGKLHSVATHRARRNIANFEMRHEDTEESETDVKAAAKIQDENQSSTSEDWRFEGQEDLGWNLDQRQGDDAMSSASEGWSFEDQQQAVARKKTARGLQFLDDPLAKAPSVQELVEGAESLVRMRPKCAIESRDASGESDSDGGHVAVGRPRPRAARPLSLCTVSDLLPPTGARAWSASETALNRTDSGRKRRMRPRKKFSSLRKNQYGSDAWTLSPSGGSDRPEGRGAPRTPPTIVKSESFSGVGGGRADSSDSSTRSESVTLLRGQEESGDVTLVQGDETGGEDLEEPQVPHLAFRLGPDAGIVTATESEKLGGEEPSSLNTEDCWDDYQEKYPSEAYSEEVADGKTLLDCDDYRQFLDSPSDTSRGPQRRRRARQRVPRRDSSDTESEPEELRSLLERSLSQLREVESLFSNVGLIVNYEELLSKCQDNIRCLKVYLDFLSAEKFIIPDVKVRNVLDQWVVLQSKLEGEGEGLRSRLEEEMEHLRCELCLLAANCEADRPRLNSKDQLDAKIAQVKNDLNAIRERKPKLQQLNAAVHRFIGVYTHLAPSMKEEVVDLYRLFTTSFESVSSELCELQQLAQDWQEFEAHLAQLQTALRADQDTLRMLDSALQCGLTGTDLADSVRDLAKVLSEKDPGTKCGMLLDDPSLLLTEGSLSDSGISDSGSEQELSEREKRLATLKNLARHLEAILEPGSLALRGMAQRIDEAEAELRGLQRTCREMIVRSAASPDDVSAIIAPKLARTAGKRKKSLIEVGGGPGPVGKPRRPSWFWRVIRSALPFQLALVALLCVACLLEPQCCDAINNLGLSHAANFRYIRGPPPV